MINLYKFKRYDVFGWQLFQRSILAGERYVVELGTESDKSSLGLMTLWVKGRITGKHVETGTISPERLPGVFTEDRSFKYAAGTYEYECTEDAEWWCFPYTANGNALPSCQAIRLSPGESMTLPAGQRAVIVFGEAVLDGDGLSVAPVSIQRDTESVLAAATQTYGFLIAGDR